MSATARTAATTPAAERPTVLAAPAVTGALWVGALQVVHGLVTVEMPGAVPAGVVAV